MTIYNFYSPAGGQGCTVAAAVFASTNDALTLLYDRAGDSRAALGLSASDENTIVNEHLHVYDGDIQPDYGLYDDVVIDWGKQTAPHFATGVNVMVVKPCYLALRRAVHLGAAKPHTILLHEDHPGRALRAVDVEATLGCTISYVMRHDPQIARTVDAGLLSARNPRQLSELNISIKEAANARTEPSRR
jgi:hypothetical protein